jgi:hypothetical protein
MPPKLTNAVVICASFQMERSEVTELKTNSENAVEDSRKEVVLQLVALALS